MNFSGLASDARIQRADSTFLSPTSIVVSGNTIELRFNSGFYDLNQAKLILKMTPNCTTCTPSSSDQIQIESFYSPSSCATGEYSLGCLTSPLSIICSDGCDYLVFNSSPTQSFFERDSKSFGLADYNNDGLPDGGPNLKATANKVNRKIAAYGDVLKLNLSANLSTNSPEDKALIKSKYLYFYSKFQNGKLLDFDSIRLSYQYSINDFTTFTFTSRTVQDTVVPISMMSGNVGVDSTEYLFKISIDTLRSRGYIPSISSNPLITISYSNFEFKAYYHVDSNPGLTISPIGVDYTAFLDTANLTSGSQVSLSKHNVCFFLKDRIQVIGFDYNSHWNTYNTFNSCDSIQVSERFRFNLGTWILGNPATNYFKNEYRNFSYLDTLNISTSKSYNITGARLSYYRTNGTLNLNSVTNIDVTGLMSGSGTSYNFNLKRLFKDPFSLGGSEPFVFSDEGYMADLVLTFEPDCQNQGGLDTINYTWNVKTDSLEPKLKNCNTLPVAKGSDRLEYVAPQLNIQPTVQLVRVKGKQVVWDVLVTNNSISYAKNLWLAFSNINSTSINVNSVQRIASGSGNNMTNVFGPTDNPPHTYTSVGNIYRVKDLYGGKDIKFRITATIDSNNCGLDSLVFTLGYSCDGYPSNLTSIICPTQELSLYAQPMFPTLFNSISTVRDTIQLCDTAEYVFTIENTNIGNAYKVNGTVYLQQYLNFISGSAEIYDNITSSWIPVTASIGSSGQYSFNVSQALSTTLSNGLPGLGDTNNKVRIRFKATAECNYTSGSKIEISSSAEAACGKTFESLPSFGSPLHIVGATPSHRNQVIVNSGYLSPCLDSTNINVRVINLGPINSWTGDSVTIALPRGVKYASGTYSPVSNATSSAPSILNYGGREYLTWTLNNLVAFVDTAEFNLKVYSIPDSIKTCDANYIYTYTTTQDSVVCSATGMPCNVKIISGDTTEAVFTYKASLDLSNPIATSIPNPPSGERVSISFDINNLGQAINNSIAGNPINTVISIYEDSDNSGTYTFGDSFLFNKSKSIFIPQGFSTYFDTLDLPAGSACNFIVVIDFEENSCICNSSSVFFSTNTLVLDEPNDTVCENEPMSVGYQDSINGYTYTWAAGSANANTAYLSSSTSAFPTFTAPSIVGNIDSMEYYIEVDRMGCKAYDTLTIYIIKTPQANVGNDTTVCYDSARLSGNIILPSPTILGTITSYWTIDSLYGNGFAGVNISNLNDPNALVTGLYSGSYKFIWNIENGICNPTTDTIQVDVINPIFDAGNDTILCNQVSYQLQGNITSPGFTSVWSILSSSPSGASFSNPNIASPTINGLQAGSYDLVLELIGPGCNFYDTVNVIVLGLDTAFAGKDSSICGISTFNLWASPVKPTRKGMWTVDSTQLNHTNISISNDTLHNSSVTFSGGGTYHLIWNSTHSLCGTVSDTIEIIIINPTLIDAGLDDTICDVNTVGYTLGATSVVSPNQGTWTQLSGSGVTITNANSATSGVTGLTTGVYEFVWNVSNGVCDTVKDTVSITVFSSPTSNAGIDDTICSSIYTLGATAVSSPNQGTWSQLSGPVATVIATPTMASTGISGLTLVGDYEYIWTVRNSVCDSVTDTVRITVFGEPTSNAGLDDTICDVNTVGYTLGATSVVSPNQGTWTQLSGSGVTITNANSATSGITGLTTGVYEFVWNVSNGVCDTVKDTVSITVFSSPTSNAGIDDTICSSIYTLGATAVSSPNQGTWSQLSGPVATVIATPTMASTGISGLTLVGDYEYIWTVRNSVCDSVTDTVRITVFGEPTSNAGLDDTICDVNTVGYTLGATSVVSPNQGTWTQLSGSGVTITNANSATSGITGLTTGVYEFVWNVSNGVCDTVKDTVSITVFSSPTSNAGIDDTICSSIYTLGATAVSSPNQGTWSQLSGPVATVIATPTMASTGISGLTLVGDYEYIWTVRNSVCDSVTDTVRITVFGEPTSNAGLDDTICDVNSVGYTLGATSVVSPNQGTWTQLSGSGVTITNVNSATSGITGLTTGVYEFVWNVSNGVCDTVKDTVSITVFSSPTSNAGIDDTICSSIYTLRATAVSSPNQGTWSQLSGPVATVIATPTMASTGISGLTLVGDYEYIWTVRNSVCDSVTDTVRITVFGEPTSNAGLDDTICVSNAAAYQFNAMAVTSPEQGRWSQISGSAVTISNINAHNTGVTGLTSGVYEFQWSVSNGVCPEIRDTFKLTVYDVPVSVTGADTQTCSPVSISLSANTPRSNETGTWSNALSNPTSATFSNANATNPVIGNLSYGTYHFIWTVDNNGICSSATDTLTLKIDSISKPFAGLDDTICNSPQYLLNADPVTGIDTGTWTQISGAPVMFGNINNPKSSLTGLAVGDYTFVWTVSNITCPSVSDTVNITVMEQSVARVGNNQLLCDTAQVVPLTSLHTHSKAYHTYNWSFYAAGSNYTTAPNISTPNLATTDIGNLSAGIYKFVLEVSNGGYCPNDYDTIQVEIFGKPSVDFNSNKTDFCLGECTNFNSNVSVSDPSGSTIGSLEWSFGDGSFSTLTNPTHCYNQIGSYDVKLKVTSSNGCVDSTFKVAEININPLPVAGFRVESVNITPGSQVVFADQSIGARDYEYSFGDGSTSFDQNPIHNYFNEGVYTVQQIVVNQFGCADTAYRDVVVNEGMKVYVPSAFTPNNDGENDVFIPIMRKVDTDKYSFKIFNRWGELLFETSDIAEGWDGTHQGVKVPSGIYVWTIVYKSEVGFTVEKKTGHVNLLK